MSRQNIKKKRYLLRLALEQKARLTGAAALMAVSALATAGYAYLVGPMLRSLFTVNAPNHPILPTYPSFSYFYGFFSELSVSAMAILIIAAAGIKGIAFFGHTALTGKAGTELLHGMRLRFYQNLLLLNPLEKGVRSTGDLVARFTTDVDYLEAAVTKGIFATIRHALELLTLAGLALLLDPFLGLLGLIAFPPTAILIVKIGKSIRKQRKAVHDATGDMGQTVEETATGLAIIRAFGAENLMVHRFESSSHAIKRASFRAIVTRAISSPLNEILAAVALALTLMYATSRIASGALTPEAFISFFSALLLLYQPVKGLGQANHNIQSGLAALSRISPYLQDTESKTEDAAVQPQSLHTLQIKNGQTGYDHQSPVLNDINLNINNREKIAIVGPSGSGKTTLLNLLEGLLPLHKGKSALNGTRLHLQNTRHLFATVRQEPFLFDDTIAMNIRIGQPRATDRDIEKVAKIAGVTQFSRQLEAHLDTRVGPYGQNLSVGQRQRICLARAIVSDAPILLLDEVTASLDGQTERSLVEGLDEILATRAVLIVTHRLSTARWADRILYINHGTIEADGASKVLLDTDPDIRELFGEQFA